MFWWGVFAVAVIFFAWAAWRLRDRTGPGPTVSSVKYSRTLFGRKSGI